MSVFIFIFIADKNCNEVLSESNEEIKVGFTELLLSLGWVKGGQPLPPLSYLKHSIYFPVPSSSHLQFEEPACSEEQQCPTYTAIRSKLKLV